LVWTEYDPANLSVPFNYSTILTQLALEVNSKSSILLSFSEVSMGEHNSRARIVELIHRLLDHLLCHHEDDTKALLIILKVRIKAQRVLSSCIDVFNYFARTLVPPTLSKLQNSPDISHEEFKGALYVLLKNRMLLLIVHYWKVMVDVWPVIVQVYKWVPTA